MDKSTKMSGPSSSEFTVSLARTLKEREAAQRLRYEVFIEELGGQGKLVDHDRRLEIDHFDEFCDHLVLHDNKRNNVAGVYRVMRRDHADAAGGFYSASEYNLSKLISSERSILELGRSCLHRNYRGGTAMYHLWNALAHRRSDRPGDTAIACWEHVHQPQPDRCNSRVTALWRRRIVRNRPESRRPGLCRAIYPPRQV